MILLFLFAGSSCLIASHSCACARVFREMGDWAPSEISRLILSYLTPVEPNADALLSEVKGYGSLDAWVSAIIVKHNGETYFWKVSSSTGLLTRVFHSLDDRPARIWGACALHYRLGMVHRLSGPAVTYNTGRVEYRVNGQFHRHSQLPAIVCPVVGVRFYEHGVPSDPTWITTTFGESFGCSMSNAVRHYLENYAAYQAQHGLLVLESSIPGSGFGVIADIDIPAGTRLFPYGGEFLTREQALARYPPGSKPAEYLLQKSRDVLIDAVCPLKSNLSRFVNRPPARRARQHAFAREWVDRDHATDTARIRVADALWHVLLHAADDCNSDGRHETQARRVTAARTFPLFCFKLPNRQCILTSELLSVVVHVSRRMAGSAEARAEAPFVQVAQLPLPIDGVVFEGPVRGLTARGETTWKYTAHYRGRNASVSFLENPLMPVEAMAMHFHNMVLEWMNE